MKLGILGRPDGWHVQQLMTAARSRNVLATCIPFEDLRADVTSRGSGHVPIDDCDAVLVRTMPRGSLEQIIFRMDVLGRGHAAGKPICNSPRSLETAIDKYLSLDRMSAAGLDVPRTMVAQTAERAMEAFDLLGGDVIIKPLFGGEGRGIMRVDDAELAGRAFRTLEQLQAVIYVQEFIAHRGYDIRVLVVGDRAVAIRRHGEGDWRTNLGRGGRAEPVTLETAWEEAARRAVQAVGATVAGVDLLPALDGRQAVLEVNAVPGWRGLRRATGANVAEWIVDHVLHLARMARADGTTRTGPL